jgi:ATPase
MRIIVPDTSVLVDGRISQLVRDEKYKGSMVQVSEVVVAELEHQAQMGHESGFKGLEELRRLKEWDSRGLVHLEFAGKRPRKADFKDNDHLIRELARESEGVLVTSDRVQALVAEGRGIEVLFMGKEGTRKEPGIMAFFDETTMSVHLKDRVPPLAKKGVPGKIVLERLSDRPMEETQIAELAGEIMEYAGADPDSFVEIERKGATVVQMGAVRIAIAKPPFSDGYEITAVRPVAVVRLEDYSLPGKLIKRLEERAEGILVAGPPGAGKSTFSQALAEFYHGKGKIVKTMESPRDLMVSDEITQYAPLEGDMEKTSDILLLVRPDYTIYDEVRKTRDFEIFADMRLAGVGMVGVTHASKAIDAIQRFIGRVELGMIPQVVDTVVFIKDGRIEKVYLLEFTVRVPMGMMEADLARPVIEVKDFETGTTEYEIYTFGEETIVMPATQEGGKGIQVSTEKILQQIKKQVPRAYVEVEMEDSGAVVWVEDGYVAKLIGKRGRRISNLEKNLGIKLDVRPLSSRDWDRGGGERVPLSVFEKGRSVILSAGKGYSGHQLGVYIDGAFSFAAKVSKKGEIKVTKASDIGQAVLEALVSRRHIHGVVE